MGDQKSPESYTNKNFQQNLKTRITWAYRTPQKYYFRLIGASKLWNYMEESIIFQETLKTKIWQKLTEYIFTGL